MSEVKVNKISPRTNCGTTTLGDSGDTFTIPAGVTITNNGTQTGFGREGSVNWQTSSIKTGNFSATNGEGYFINSSSSITMSLPAGSAGAIVAVSDYARNFATHNFIINPNGSEKIGGVAAPTTLDVNGQAATFVYVDSTKGWVNVQNAEDTEIGNPYISATGGCSVVTSGDHKIHVFKSPGTLTITNAGAPTGSDKLDYLVVAGGGGGSIGGGGGGGGGYRFSAACTSTAPLPVTATGYPVTVGGGGTGSVTSPGSCRQGGKGNDSIFAGSSTITSTGGGSGGGEAGGFPAPTLAGGSGGGSGFGCASNVFGAGNTPPVSPAQGNPGGGSTGCRAGSGGGGAAATGGTGGTPITSGGGGTGGAGSTSHLPLFPAPGPYYTADQPGRGATAPGAMSGGGGGASWFNSGPGPVSGGVGGGGRAVGNPNGGSTATGGVDNSGGGGGTESGGGVSPSGCTASAHAGGSGIVLIRYKFQN